MLKTAYPLLDSARYIQHKLFLSRFQNFDFADMYFYAFLQVQTDEEPKKKLRLADDNSSQLVEFLQRVEGYVSKQLINNLRSRAFDGLYN